MFKWLNARRQRNDVAVKLYNHVVAHARSPEFYLSFGVPDSELGRFEMICLHSYLLFRRLGRTDIAGKDLSQAVHDLMFADLDRTLREQGIGDMGIGKRVKKLARNLYGRIDAYEKGFAGGADDLADALRRNLYASADASDGEVAAMIAYIQGAIDSLEMQSISEIMVGSVSFPSATVERKGQS
ncbi:MAG: phage tail protein [Alphaproteobacteria bacterium]|nr:phage tail protein [Alphaproteobacteria bacterium]